MTPAINSKAIEPPAHDSASIYDYRAKQKERIESIYADLLDELFPDWATNPHMIETPHRVAKFWQEFLHEPAGKMTAFPVEYADQMIVVRDIETWSMCAHHLLPFSATVSIGYIPADEVLGLSKFARIAHEAAHRPTSQEELVASIADKVTSVTGSPSVAVRASGLHLCMAMRGVRTPATMTTSVTRGAFRDDPRSRAEWLALID